MRPESAYVLLRALLHFTFASGISRVGHAGCAEFSFSHSAEFSFLLFSSVFEEKKCQVQAGSAGQVKRE